MELSREWLQLTASTEHPSSFTANVIEDSGPIILIANGSPYLYCLDASEGDLLV